MFSTVLHSFASSLFSYNTPSDSESSFQIDQQLQTELEQAAQQGMVFTRSQDNTPDGGASQDVMLKKKRKAGDGGEEYPAQPVTKRSRRLAKSNGDTAPASSARKPGRPRKNGDAIHVAVLKESDQEPSSQDSLPTSPSTPAIFTDQTVDEDNEDKAIEVAMNKPNQTSGISSEVLHAHDRIKLGAEGATRSRNGRTRDKRTTDSEGVAGVDKSGVDISAIQEDLETLSPTAAKATHRRFGSDDIEVVGMAPSTGIEERKGVREDVSEDESGSGNEAPETVTASAGFDKARTSALEAARGAAKQKAEKKVKRREHDQRLRLQAKSAKDPRPNDKPFTEGPKPKGSSTEVTEADGQMLIEGSQSASEFPEVTKDEDGKPASKSQTSRKTPLPLLLPEEILAAQPVVRAPKLPFPKSKVAISQKRKFLELESKPPKDIKRGDVTIRVLQDNRSILPPKSSQLSKTLRESWLMGRKGFKGEIGVPRRKLGAGFVRRKG